MFKEFAVNVISLAFLGSIVEMISPEGTIKKYIKLIMGFMMIAILIAPFGKNSHIPQFEFSLDYDITNEEIRAKSDAYTLKLHEENIVNYVKSVLGENVEVFVEIYTDGNVKSVTVRGISVGEDVLNSLKNELGCEKIEVISGDDFEN